MNNARDKTQQCEQNIEPEMAFKPHLKKNTQGGQNYGKNNFIWDRLL